MYNHCGTKDSLCNLLKPLCIFYQLRDPLLSSSYESFTHLPSSDEHTQTSNENSGNGPRTDEPSHTSSSPQLASFLLVHQINNSNGHPIACEALQQLLKKLRPTCPEENNPSLNTSEELDAEATPWDIIETMGTGGQRVGSRGRRHPALPHRRYSVPEAVMRRYSLSRLGNADTVPILPTKMSPVRGPPHLDSPSRTNIRLNTYGTPKLSRRTCPIVPPLNLDKKSSNYVEKTTPKEEEILQTEEENLTIQTMEVVNVNSDIKDSENNNSIIIITSNYDNETTNARVATPADISSTTSTDSKHIQTETCITRDASTCYQAPTPPTPEKTNEVEERRVSFAKINAEENQEDDNLVNNPVESPFLASPAEDTGSMTLCLSSTTDKTTSQSSAPADGDDDVAQKSEPATPWQQPLPTSSSLDGSEKWTPRENAMSSTTQDDNTPRSDDREHSSSTHSPISSSHFATKSHSLHSSANSISPSKIESQQSTPRQQTSPTTANTISRNSPNNNHQSRSRNFTSIFQTVPEEEPLNRQTSSDKKSNEQYDDITTGLNRPVGVYHTTNKGTQNIWRREEEDTDETDKMSQHSWSSGWQSQGNNNKDKINLTGGSLWMKNDLNEGTYSNIPPPPFAQRFVVPPQECQPKWNQKPEPETYRWSQRSDEERYVIRKQQKQRYVVEKRLHVDNLPPTPQRENFSNIVTGSIYERNSKDSVLIVPRFSALPRSMSMLVNTSSGDGSSEATESDCSLLDSLEGDEHGSTASSTKHSIQSEPIRPLSSNLKSESFYIPIERHKTPPPPPAVTSRPPSANTSFFVPINDTGQVPPDDVASVLPPKLRARLARRHEHLLEEARNRHQRDHERPSSAYNKRKPEPRVAIKVASKDSERARPRHDPGRISRVEIPSGQDSVIIDVHAHLESPTDSEKHAERILLASVRASLTPVPKPNSPKHRQYKLMTPPPGNNDEEILLRAIVSDFGDRVSKAPSVRDLRLETPPEISDVERPSDNPTTQENTDYEEEQVNDTKIIRVSPEGENRDANSTVKINESSQSFDQENNDLSATQCDSSLNSDSKIEEIDEEGNLNKKQEDNKTILSQQNKLQIKLDVKKTNVYETKIRSERKKMYLPLNKHYGDREDSKLPSPKKLVSPRGSGIPVLLPGASLKMSREKVPESKSSRLPVRQSSLRRPGGGQLQRFRQQFDAIPEERSSVSLESPPESKLKKERVNTETKRASENKARDENVNILNTGGETIPRRPGAAGRYRGGKAALAQTSTDHGADLAALSRGWINFYLLGERGGGGGSIEQIPTDKASQDSPRYGKMSSSNERMLPELRHVHHHQLSPKLETSGDIASSEVFSSSETASSSSMELERTRFRTRRHNQQQIRHWNNRKNRGTPLSSSTPPASSWSVTVASAGSGLAATAPASLEMRLTFPTPSGASTTTTTSTTTNNVPAPVAGNTSDSGLGEDKEGVHPFRSREPVLPPPSAPHRLTYTVRNQGSFDRLRSTTHTASTNILPELRGEAKRRINFENPPPLTAPSAEMKFSNSLVFTNISDDLSVKGAAITPERKPRVPTMTERDLTGRYLDQSHY